MLGVTGTLRTVPTLPDCVGESDLERNTKGLREIKKPTPTCQREVSLID